LVIHIIDAEEIVLVISILIVLFLLSILFNVFDRKGSVVALLLGLLVGLGGGVNWLLLMIVFALSSFAATKAFFSMKKSLSLQEGRSGERRTANIMYAGAIVGVLSMLNLLDLHAPFSYLQISFLAAVSFAVIGSDTFASEIGFIDRKTIMITTFRRVEPGINGGISLVGSLAAVLGGLVIGITFSLLFLQTFSPYVIGFITLMGFIGSNVDSVLGAVAENRGLITKEQVNLLASLTSVVLAASLVFIYNVL
jgi:uncharacterized protein (TIGR00297 family)